MTFKEVYNIVLPERKRKEEKFNFFVSLVVRPLSILLTLPFIKTRIKPTTITKISILFSCAGFGLLAFGQTLLLRLIGWGLLFLWAVFDGVDGNLARCTNQCSALGDLWDTMGGYLAMVFIFFASGITAYYDENLFDFFDPYILIILGGATAIFSIFPRLVMHKKKSSEGDSESIKKVSDKQHFGIKNIIAMNFISPSGFLLVILLLSIIFHVLNFFIVFYCGVTFIVMMASLWLLLR